MEKRKVYDLPTRFFHWLFAGLFVTIYAIAQFVDSDSSAFSQHMLLGLILLVTTLLRVLWGIVGSRYARFSSFPLRPTRVLAYFLGMLGRQGGAKYFAHNPASAWSAVLMIVLALGLGGTGYLMATGYKESLEDIHGLMANSFAVVALAHVVGVAFHIFRYRDGLAFSMFHGKKEPTEGAPPITHSHRPAAAAMLFIIGLFAGYLYKNYDAAKGTTSLAGVTLQLGEGETGDN